MRKKDLFRRKSKESSDSDTPKSSFMLWQYRPMNMDRASKVLHDKNSSNRLISKSALRPKNKKRDQPNDYRPAISVISEKFSEQNLLNSFDESHSIHKGQNYTRMKLREEE